MLMHMAHDTHGHVPSLDTQTMTGAVQSRVRRSPRCLCPRPGAAFLRTTIVSYARSPLVNTTQRNVLARSCRNNKTQNQQQHACGLSSQASPKKSESERKNKRTEEEARKVAEHKAAVKEYKLKMTALRKEIQKEVCARVHHVPWRGHGNLACFFFHFCSLRGMYILCACTGIHLDEAPFHQSQHMSTAVANTLRKTTPLQKRDFLEM